MKRDERKRWIRQVRNSQLGSNHRDESRKIREQEQTATWADRERDQLLLLGEIKDESGHIRAAQTIAEEEQSIRLFAAALHLQIEKGETLLQLLSRTYRAWCEGGRLLLNPVSGKFSEEFRPPSGDAESLASVWTFQEPMDDYNKPLALDADAAADTPKETRPTETEEEKILRRINETAPLLAFFTATPGDGSDLI